MAITEKELIRSKLPLDSLEIKGYRAFRELTIPKLARVNLITGKNNVGKSSLLEAIQLYALGGSPAAIRDILQIRGELGMPLSFTPPIGFQNNMSGNGSESWMAYVSSLFHGRKSIFQVSNDSVVIGSLGDPSRRLRLEVKWVNPSKEVDGKPEYVPITLESNLESLLNAEPRIVLQAAGRPEIQLSFNQPLSGVLYWMSANQIAVQRVGPNGTSNHDLVELWDRIAITDLEQDIIRGLRLVDDRVQRIAFPVTDDRTGERIPVVKLSDSDQRIPLGSLGDGINRLLAINVAMANSQNGILLLDEIENGLHYSIMPDVWELIIDMAVRLNVQVFATTHSWDCIVAFQRAVSSAIPDLCSLIRLIEKRGSIVPTMVDSSDLRVIVDGEIEVR